MSGSNPLPAHEPGAALHGVSGQLNSLSMSRIAQRPVKSAIQVAFSVFLPQAGVSELNLLRQGLTGNAYLHDCWVPWLAP